MEIEHFDNGNTRVGEYFLMLKKNKKSFMDYYFRLYYFIEFATKNQLPSDSDRF